MTDFLDTRADFEHDEELILSERSENVLNEIENLKDSDDQEIEVEIIFDEDSISPTDSKKRGILRTPNSTPRLSSKIGFRDTISVLRFEKDCSPTTLSQSAPTSQLTSDSESKLRLRRFKGSRNIAREGGLINYTTPPSARVGWENIRPRNSLVALKHCFAEVQKDRAAMSSNFPDELDDSLDSSDMDTAFSEISSSPEIPRKRRSIDALRQLNEEQRLKEKTEEILQELSVTVTATETSSCELQTLLYDMTDDSEDNELDETVLFEKCDESLETDPDNEETLEQCLATTVQEENCMSPGSVARNSLKLLQDQCLSKAPKVDLDQSVDLENSFEMPHSPSPDTNELDVTVIHVGLDNFLETPKRSESTHTETVLQEDSPGLIGRNSLKLMQEQCFSHAPKTEIDDTVELENSFEMPRTPSLELNELNAPVIYTGLEDTQRAHEESTSTGSAQQNPQEEDSCDMDLDHSVDLNNSFEMPRSSSPELNELDVTVIYTGWKDPQEATSQEEVPQEENPTSTVPGFIERSVPQADLDESDNSFEMPRTPSPELNETLDNQSEGSISDQKEDCSTISPDLTGRNNHMAQEKTEQPSELENSFEMARDISPELLESNINMSSEESPQLLDSVHVKVEDPDTSGSYEAVPGADIAEPIEEKLGTIKAEPEDVDHKPLMELPATYFLDNMTPLTKERSSFSDLLGPHGGGMLPAKITTTV